MYYVVSVTNIRAPHVRTKRDILFMDQFLLPRRSIYTVIGLALRETKHEKGHVIDTFWL